MNEDQVKGRTEELAGKTKKIAGKVIHDNSLKQKGGLQEVAGKARAIYGDTTEEVKKAAPASKPRVSRRSHGLKGAAVCRPCAWTDGGRGLRAL